VALLPLGALVGSFLATLPLNYLGRKPTVMLSGDYLLHPLKKSNMKSITVDHKLN
jgi:hypothetical protein